MKSSSKATSILGDMSSFGDSDTSKIWQIQSAIESSVRACMQCLSE